MTRDAIKPRAGAMGFTLVELLVVIAIIGLLAGVFIPAFHKARLSADLVQGQSVMKKIGTAVSQYTVEHQGRLPQLDADYQWLIKGKYANQLAAALEPYFDKTVLR